MATVRQAIGEIDVVELTAPVDRWPVGTVGTVVMDYGEMKMIEIANERGETLALPTVPAQKLKLLIKYSD